MPQITPFNLISWKKKCIFLIRISDYIACFLSFSTTYVIKIGDCSKFWTEHANVAQTLNEERKNKLLWS